MSYSDIPGWMDFGWLYREWVGDVRAGAVIVEVGVCFGRSLAYLAREAIDQGRDDITIIGIDPWVTPQWVLDEPELAALVERHGGFYSAFLSLMGEHAPAELERAITFRGTSQEYCDGCDCLFDRVYIDGDHALESVRADLATWVPRMKPGGVIAGHDFGRKTPGHDGVEPAVREAFGDDIELRGSTWLHRVAT